MAEILMTVRLDKPEWSEEQAKAWAGEHTVFDILDMGADVLSESAKQTVWVAAFSSRKTSAETRVFATEAGAKGWRQEIADETWDENGPNKDKPEDPVKMADRYWERQNDVGEDFFSIEECEVQG